MLVSLDWLNELVDISDLKTEDIVNHLSLYSTEVEGVERVLSGTNLTVGHVLECVMHPDSDHLHICKIDVGSDVLQIVCGAPNIKEGLFVIVALEGCVLPGGLKIKKSKIRGVESNGMVCSLAELGMEKKFIPEEYADGIYYFTKPCKAGDNPLKLLHYEREVLDLAITPNRSDLMSMLGVAYEVSASFNRPLKPLVSILLSEGGKNKDYIDVKVQTLKCKTYYAKVVRNVKIRKSPYWLISRLISFGIRPINNAVDITNYILALYGQPLHAFDYDLLGKHIVVRDALENETIVTLDNIERKLLKDDIVITDGKKPVALAGVMGGLDTSINDNTKNIVLEAAVFDPISVRKTYTRLDLRSESSIRFEKGLDLNRTKEALDYACQLFEQLCGADVCFGDVYAGIKKEEPKHIIISSKEISDYLGVKISNNEVEDLLKRLQFDYKFDKKFDISVPTRRMDIAIKADIIEEIGRLHGYENLPTTLPKTDLPGGLTPFQKRRRDLKHTLVNLGLVEAVNYSLKENNDEFRYLMYKDESDIELLLPISSERKLLRRELVSSLLGNVSYCYNRKIKNCAYFEIGKVYSKKLNGEYTEEEHLAIAISNEFSSTLWEGKKEIADFYLLKGLINQAFSKFDITFDYDLIDEEMKEMHPLRTAKIMYHNKKVGFIGEIHPKYAQDHDLDNVYVAEIKLDEIMHYEDEIKVYTPVTKAPSVERDFAFVMEKDIEARKVVEAIKAVDRKLISDVIVFDVYMGDKLLKNTKSIAIKVVFTSNDTLTDEIINSKVNKILKALESGFGIVLRA